MTPTRPSQLEWVLYGATAAYALMFCTLSVMQHVSFHTGYDLAGAMHGLWGLSSGESQVNTLWGTRRWLTHLYLFRLPLVPVYRFVPSPYLLLLLQTVALALGAPVLYRIAWEKTHSARLSLVLALCYLGYPALHFANLFDFHWNAFAPLFLLLTLYYADKSLPRLLLCAALALACREDVALTLLAMGVYIARRENRWSGLALCALSALWFLAAVGGVIPLLSGGRPTPHLAYWAAYGESPGQVARFVLTHPLQTLRILLLEHDGLKYIFKVNLFLLFLPLLAPEALLMALPFFVLRFLSTFEPHHNIYFHFSLTETPILFYAAVIGARRLLQLRCRVGARGQRGKRAVSQRIDSSTHLRIDLARHSSLLTRHLSTVSLSAALLLCLVTTSALLGPFRTRGQYKLGFARFVFTERSRVLGEICRQIPPDAGVSTSHWLTPHLAHRRFVYMFPNPYQRAHWNGMPGEPDYGKYTVSGEPTFNLRRGREVEWVVIDKESPIPGNIPDLQAEILAGLQQSGEFEVVRDDPIALVLRRSHPPPP